MGMNDAIMTFEFPNAEEAANFVDAVVGANCSRCHRVVDVSDCSAAYEADVRAIAEEFDGREVAQ